MSDIRQENSTRINEWLDDVGAFKFGKHAGEIAEDVVRTDPMYVTWVATIAESVCDEDRAILRALLERRRP